MKLRRNTLAEFFGVIAVLVLVVVVQGWFWTLYTSSQRKEIAEQRRAVERLKGQVDQLERQKTETEKRGEEYTRQINERDQELQAYGDFLPSVGTKPMVIKEILSLVEELGVKIWKIENSPMVTSEGCFTFNFSLKLEGPYKSFKLFLAKIYKSERIFRIKKFEVASFDNQKHNMEVFVEFQTYFAGS